MSKAKKRYFVLDKEAKCINYFVGKKDDGSGKDAKGSIPLNDTEKVVCEDPKLFIHNPDRVWSLKADGPGMVEEWGNLLAEVVIAPVQGRKSIKADDMTSLMSNITLVKKDAADDTPSKLFEDRVDVRSVMLQRPTKESKYGVQFSPYEGTAEGVMICGVTEGGPGDGLVRAGEKVVGINGQPCSGKTYPEAVNLMRSVVDGSWAILKLDVQYRELWGVCSFEYEATNDTELSMKIGDRIRVVSDEENGWLQGDNDGTFGWFPATYVDLEPEKEIERYNANTDGTVAAKRSGPFPETKLWNHGRINRQVQEERANAYSGDNSKGSFLARMKDKTCFSICIRYPTGGIPDVREPNEIQFVLFEKNAETGLWHADKGETGLGDTLGAAVDAHLQALGIGAAEPISPP